MRIFVQGLAALVAGSLTGLIYVYLVQHAGFPGDGKESGGAFRKAATEKFGK